jgi:hypothetical protein
MDNIMACQYDGKSCDQIDTSGMTEIKQCSECSRFNPVSFDGKYSNLKRWVDMPSAPKEFVMSLFAEISKDPESRKTDNRERLSVLEAEFMKKNEGVRV